MGNDRLEPWNSTAFRWLIEPLTDELPRKMMLDLLDETRTAVKQGIPIVPIPRTSLKSQPVTRFKESSATFRRSISQISSALVLDGHGFSRASWMTADRNRPSGL